MLFPSMPAADAGAVICSLIAEESFQGVPQYGDRLFVVAGDERREGGLEVLGDGEVEQELARLKQRLRVKTDD